MNRRNWLKQSALVAGACILGGLRADADSEGAPDSTPAKPPGRGRVHVIVFSNFEGWPVDPEPAIRWFDDCRRAHPALSWTHMYSPWHLLVRSPEAVRAEAAFSPWLLEACTLHKAEVGLHVHMNYDMIRQMGLQPRGFPYASDPSADCRHPRRIEEDRGQGYDVLMTGYSEQERRTVLDVSVGAFLGRGFPRPTSFCAGYSAADPALQALLVERGFSVSFAAQVTPPEHYGGCWDRLLEWSRRITPLTIPYRVSKTSILPPPQAGDKHLDLVEVPLNMGVDAYDLFLEGKPVPRQEIFDRHLHWAQQTGNETAVAIGVHAEVIAREAWGSGPVFQVVEPFLQHVQRRQAEGLVDVEFGTVSQIARRFRENTRIGQVT
ncbi:MAG: hypothetical protein ACKV0T_10615 [Planctomycetales bacterium]